MWLIRDVGGFIGQPYNQQYVYTHNLRPMNVYNVSVSNQSPRLERIQSEDPGTPTLCSKDLRFLSAYRVKAGEGSTIP